LEGQFQKEGQPLCHQKNDSSLILLLLRSLLKIPFFLDPFSLAILLSLAFEHPLALSQL
jgi:hypothetical protein